jgi:hypothetical protein
MSMKSNGEALAIVSSLMHDPGVSQEREDRFLDFMGESEDGRPFNDILRDYNFHRVKTAHNPEFGGIQNSGNQALPPDEPLVSVFFINGLSIMFLWAKTVKESALADASEETRTAIQVFRAYPNLADANGGPALLFVDGIMSDRLEREKFLRVLGKIHAAYQRTQPYHPIWLTKQSDLQICANTADDEKASCWAHRVGISTARKDSQWIVILRFQPGQFKDLYRPCVLDGVTAEHAPAPESYPAKLGGIAVDLRMAKADPGCEFVAHWPLFEEAEFDTENSCAQVKSVSEKPILETRKCHFDRLRLRDGTNPTAIEWLDRIQATEAAKTVSTDSGGMS